MAAPIGALMKVSVRKSQISLGISTYFVTSMRYGSMAPHIKKKNARKQSKYLAKLSDIVAETKKKRKWYTSNPGPIVSQHSGNRPVSQGMMRRVRQLNVVFHESIYCSFYYEDICPQLLEYGLEISKVVISNDFNNLTVYWTASGDMTKDNDMAALLDTCKGKLRSSLMAKRVIGRVPPIQFVKDIKSAQSQIVEDLLDRADMGEDFKANEIGHIFKSALRTPFHSKMSRKEAVEAIECDSDQTSYSYLQGPGAKLVVWKNVDYGECSTNYCHIPQANLAKPQNTEEGETVTCEEAGIMLRSDLYDLDHTKLLHKVTQIKNKFRDRNYQLESETVRKDELSKLKSKELSSAVLDSAKIHKLLKASKPKEKYSRSSAVSLAAWYDELDTSVEQYARDDDDDAEYIDDFYNEQSDYSDD